MSTPTLSGHVGTAEVLSPRHSTSPLCLSQPCRADGLAQFVRAGVSETKLLLCNFSTARRRRQQRSEIAGHASNERSSPKQPVDGQKARIRATSISHPRRATAVA